MITAAAYIRVSTEEQVEYSPDSQVKAIQDYAKRNDMIVPNEFIFMDEGISGRSTKRPAFQKMIGTAKIKPKPFDVILLWKFSRFARNREDSIVYKSMLRKQCGIDVISISENIGEDKTSILIEALIEAMDEYYSVNLAEEVKRGMGERFSRGQTIVPPPYGYKANNGTYEIVPEQAEIVRQIFNDYLAGMPTVQITKKYNELGITTRGGHKLENRNIKYFLLNPTYTGKLRRSTKIDKKDRFHTSGNVEIVDGKHEAIIDEQTFQAVQDKLNEDKVKYAKHARHTSSVEFMLRGLVKCDTCGSTLVMSIRNVGLQCHKYCKGACDVSHYISINKINKLVIDKLKEDLGTGNFDIKIDHPKSETDPDDMIEKMLRKEYKKLDRIKEAYEAGVYTLDEFKQSKENISATIAELQKKRPLKPRTHEETIKLLQDKVKASLCTLDNEDASETIKNEVLRSIISEIIFIKSKGIIELHYHL